jgi:porin
MTLLSWKQVFNEGRGTFIAGFIDVTDYVDVYLLASPWTGFNNFVFSTGSAAMDLPNESAFGGGVGHMISDSFYLQAGLVDANSDPTEPFESFSTFFDLRDTYKWIELGWTPGQEQIYFDNAHLTLWQIDERANGTPAGWGFNLSYQRWIDDKWLPFARFGYADDSGSLLERSISIGIGYQPVPMRGVIGFGLNWGQPNEASFGDLDSQFTAETYWRYQLTQEIAVTPSLQYIRNPALSPDQTSMWAFGFRFRYAL